MKSLVWLRRDLRLHDHAALFNAIHNSDELYICFVFDTKILNELPNKNDRRIEFIFNVLKHIDAELKKQNGQLICLYGDPCIEIPKLCNQLNIDKVYANEDYEDYATQRDEQIKIKLQSKNIKLSLFKDQVLYRYDEILSQSGNPYSIFTPYKNNHLKKLVSEGVKNYEIDLTKVKFGQIVDIKQPNQIEDLGFKNTNLQQLKISTSHKEIQGDLKEFSKRINTYDSNRNFPAIKGVSYLSIHNRFGTLSIRELANLCLLHPSSGADIWLSELIWRDFYFQIIVNFPHVQKNQSFKKEYNNLNYENNQHYFELWCKGKTGFPIVDAAMRQLNQTGFMHNRLRMIVASFLTKDLLVDWRWGEKYFADNLNDYDFSANNGGWQWAASVGCDAQPWFRIFNPTLQSKKFDPEAKFIKKYIPEISELDQKVIHDPYLAKNLKVSYPNPIVNHAEQREKALLMFKNI
jgi:deoxyribodipyrimidine photo-lyase